MVESKPTTKEEYTKIKKELGRAKQKLSSIIDATNRDQLLMEEKSKNIKFLTDQENELEDRLSKLKETISEEEVGLSTTQKKNKAERVEMLSKKAKLTDVLSELEERIKDETNKLENIKLANEKAKKKIAEEYEAVVDDFNNKKLELGLKEKELGGSIAELQETIVGLIAKKEKQENEIAENQKKLDWQAIQLSELLKNMNKTHSLDSEIKTKQEKVVGIDKEIKELDEARKAKANENNKLEFDLIKLRNEKGEIVKARLAVSDREIALNSKEQYIKEKFKSAWLTY